MSLAKGTTVIVDGYKNNRLVAAAYKNGAKVFDAYTEITAPFLLTFNSRVAGALKDYRLYGDSDGSGVQTENLFDYTAQDTSKGYVSGKILLSDGSEDINGGYYISEYIDISNLISDKITIYIGTSLIRPSLCFYDANKDYISGANYGGHSPKVYDIPSNAKYCRFTVVKQTAYSSITMLVPGSSTSTSYIPYGYKIPISLTDGTSTSNYDLYVGSTKLGEEEHLDYQEQKVYRQFEISGLSEPLCGINEYKDTLALSTGTVTRYIKKLVLTGTENWTSAGTNVYFRITIGALYTVLNSYDLFCTHFVTANISSVTTEIGAAVYNSGSSNSATLNIRPLGSMTLNAFKQFLADEYANGTPVTVWYVLATPTTETITVPTGFTGTVEGFMSQSGTPTQAAPIYPTANGEKQPNDTYSVLTLQPTDPPVPLPAINAYKGENTLSSTETVGNVTVKGRIKEAVPNG